ncbi:pertactin family virulence factor/autotransporter [Yersinia frederiksenii]|uniref:autotransporter outer membrane beta-barrel domain-containing protein n=1 Tax=Yersinia frederiksenii TaxID=29484 RepID=UPI0005E7AF29|nr:autotransporter outer membrane beta-barrel domain-containing protein [Yersinia frederiksenii]CFR06869.1 pertactin family virulence factor/autotransporter [Yersinia frederiksenii]
MKKQTVLRTRVLPLSLIVSYLVSGNAFATADIPIANNGNVNIVTIAEQDLAESMVNITKEMETAKKQAQSAIKKFAGIKAKADGLDVEIKEKQQQLDKASQLENEANAQLAHHLASLTDINSRISALNEKKSATEQAITSAQRAKNSADSQLHIAGMPLDASTKAKAAADGKLQKVEETLSTKTAEMAQLQLALQHAENTRQQAEIDQADYLAKLKATTDSAEKESYRTQMMQAVDTSSKAKATITKTNRLMGKAQEEIDAAAADKKLHSNAIIKHSSTIEQAQKEIALAQLAQKEAQALLEESSKQLITLEEEKSNKLQHRETINADYKATSNKVVDSVAERSKAESAFKVAESEKNNYAQTFVDAQAARNAALKVQRDLEKAIGSMVATEQDEIDLSAAKNEALTVAKDASTLGAQINGGTQKVLAGGAAKGSVITDDGKVELEADSLAENTLVENGTLTNDSGTDIGTIVMADGTYILAGTAISENAVINGNEVTLYSGDYTIDPYTLNPGVLITDQAKTTDMTLNTRAMAMLNSKNAKMSNTQVSGMLYNEAGIDTGTNVLAGGTLIVNGNDALSVNANIGQNGEAVVVNGGTASNMLSAGKIIAADGGVINSLTMHGGSFDLLNGAQASNLKATRGMVKAFGTLNNVELHESALNIANTAMVSGVLNADKNSIINMVSGANTANTDLILAGQMTFFAAEQEEATGLRTKRSTARAAAVPQGTQHSFKSVVLDGGTVDLTQTANNTQLQMGTLSGKGNFKLNTLNNATGAPIKVTGKADGSFDIEIQDSGTTPTNLNVVQTGLGSSASFKLNRATSQGNYQYNLVDNGNGTFKLVANTSKLAPSTAGVLAVANTSPVIFNAELSSVNNRLDRLTTFSHEDGIWLTYLNNNFKVNGTATNFDQTLNGVTLGADKTAEMDNGALTFGGFFSHSNSSIKTDYQSSGKVDSYSLGAYALYQHRNGYFVNGVLKGNQFSQDVNVAMQGTDNAKGTSKFAGLGLAVKAGKNIERGALTVTPYAGISGFNGFKDDYKLSNGMQAQSKSNRSVIGTIGVNTGYQINLKNGAIIKPYTTVSVEQEWVKGNKMVINNEQFGNDLSGTRANVGLGMNAQVSKNVSVTSEVKFAKGKNISSPVTMNVGISYSF